MSCHIPCHLSHACKIRSKRNCISDTLQPNTEHWASLKETLTSGWCVHPLLWQIFLIPGKTGKQGFHNLGVPSSKSLDKEPDRIFSKLIKSLVFNLIGLFKLVFYKIGTQIKSCFPYFFLSRDPVNTTDPKSNSLWLTKQSWFCSALKQTELIYPQCSQNTNH